MITVKQQRLMREESILLSLKKLDYLTRKQLQILHDLKSDRNAQRILKEMDKYLSSFYDGHNVYYLNKEGRERVNCDVIRKKTHNVNHYLMRNDVYIDYECPESWRNEIRFISQKGKSKFVVVCDATFEKDGITYLVEIDNTQTMKKNRVKIEKYRRMIERNVFGGMPRLIWVTTTPYRAELLKELCDGLEVGIYLTTDFR